MKKVVLSVLLFSPAALAQASPPAAGSVNFLATVSQGVTDLVTNVAPSIMPFAWAMLGVFGVYQLLQTLLQTSLRQMSTHYFVPMATVIAYVAVLFRIVIAVTMLTFYLNPIPGLGLNFHQIFPKIGNGLAAAVSQDLLNSVFQFFKDALANLPDVGMFQVQPALIAIVLIVLIGLSYLALLVITASAITIIGLLSLCGPLMIPFYVLAGHDQRFWRWLDNMVAYSMYGFTSACFVYVMCHPYMDLVANINGNWSIGQWLVSIPYLLLITASAIYIMPKVPELTHLLFGGIGTSASHFLGMVQGLTVRAVAALL